MKQIEADFGINLKDIKLGEINVFLGDVEYLFMPETGLWKTKVIAQNVDELDIEEATGYDKAKGRNKKNQKQEEEDDQMTVEDMRA